jgi:hypothetical protein
MRKANRKRAVQTFTKIIQKQSDPEAFTDKLELDIKARVERNQIGFDTLHPTTYLNDERWNDDLPLEQNPIGERNAVSKPANQQNRPEQTAGDWFDDDDLDEINQLYGATGEGNDCAA